MTRDFLMHEIGYLTHLAAAIDDFLIQNKQFRNWSSIPDNRSQNTNSWETSRTHDLATSLLNGRIIALEVKIINSTGKLKSPKLPQYNLNLALQDFGHPIRYCFNLLPSYSAPPGCKNRTLYLDKSQCSLPSELSNQGKNIQINHDCTLLCLLEELISASDGAPRNALADAYLAGLCNQWC